MSVESMNAIQTSGAWLLAPPPGPERRVRLFCMPHAGGGAAAFRLWPSALPDEVEVCRIQLPGRESRIREPLIRDAATLVGALADALEPRLDLPWLFFGHSMGALIGFETCRELRRRGRGEPAHFFAAGFRAPHVAPDQAIHGLDEEAFLDAMDRRYGGIPAALRDEPELLALLVPVLRADMAVCESYRHAEEPPLDAPLTALGGEGDGWVGRERLLAWGRHTAGRFESAFFDGGHFFLDAHREAVLERVARACRAAAAGRGA